MVRNLVHQVLLHSDVLFDSSYSRYVTDKDTAIHLMYNVFIHG